VQAALAGQHTVDHPLWEVHGLACLVQNISRPPLT
jgi:hypothetical protein